ncbi:MAG: lysozyme inhibitor LprI family protein [Candidatus Sericytochromatia bacterium]
MKTRFWLCFSVFCLLLLPAPTVLAESETDCSRDDLPQQSMNICAAQDYRKVDAELNRLYKQVMADLTPERRQQLLTAQLAWLKYRDAHCKFEADAWKGGSMAPFIHGTCMARLTRERNLWLKSELENDG